MSRDDSIPEPPHRSPSFARSVPSRSPPSSWRLRLGRFARLARKELRETLRDRRTIATLVLMPLLIYPLISLLFQRFLLNSLPGGGGDKGAPHYLIAFESEADQNQFSQLLAMGDGHLKAHLAREASALERDAAAKGTLSSPGRQSGGPTQPESRLTPELPLGSKPAKHDPVTARFQLESTVVRDLRQEVAEKHVDLGIRLRVLPAARVTPPPRERGLEKMRGDPSAKGPKENSPRPEGPRKEEQRENEVDPRDESLSGVGIRLPSPNEPKRRGRRGNPPTGAERSQRDADAGKGDNLPDKKDIKGTAGDELDTEAEPAENFRLEVELVYSDRLAGIPELLDYLEIRLQAVNRADRDIKLSHAGFSPDEVPVRWNRTPLESAGPGGGFSLAGIVPLILILMTITGAVYPAIDLSAGERERGTLEMLAAAPISRMSLLTAKYVAVLTVAILTAVVNLTAMTITIQSSGLGRLLLGEDSLSWQTMLQVFALLVLFAAFFSAVLLAITSFARSFKEAQAYLIPLMLASIAPGILALMPSLKLEGALTVIPLANIVLLSRDLFLHQVQPATATIVVFTTALYALGAIAIAARIFGTDAILYGSQESWSDLFQRPERVSPAPSLSSALLCLAFLFPLQVLAGGYVGQFGDLPLSQRLLLTSLLSVLLYVGCPLVAAWLRRVELRSAFNWRAPAWSAWPAALVLGLTTWLSVIELVNLTRLIHPDEAPQVLRDLTEQLMLEFHTVSPMIVLLALAVIPAITEEFFFRGFLLGALRQRFGDWQCILVSGVLFGLFHLVVRDSLAVERLLPSTLLGCLLGWICLRTGSLFPGILMHAMNNSSVLMLMYYRSNLEHWLRELGWNVDDVSHVPWPLLLFSAGGIAIGCALVSRSRRT